MTFESMNNVHYPPVGIVHISREVGQLVAPHLRNRKTIHINTSAQPNSNPHLGTVTTLMTAFAIGEYLGAFFRLPVRLTFDELENAPGEKRIEEGIEYQKSLADITDANGISLAERYMSLFRWVFDELSKRTGISCQIRRYREFQQKKTFRRNLLRILQRQDEFAPFLSPAEGVIRFRFPCPQCQWVDKPSRTVRVEEISSDRAVLSSQCFQHGEHRVILSEDTTDFIDTNTPLRDVAKGCALIEEGKEHDELIVMCDGGDWGGVWNMQIFCNGITRLGYAYEDLPFRFFAPTITDWSGAKFSKSLYVQSDAYEHLPEGFVNLQKFLDTYGASGFETLWQEVRSWPLEPKKLFRDYSIDYFRLVLESTRQVGD